MGQVPARLRADLRLVHFVGHDKAWNDRTGTLPPGDRQAHADVLDRHFPRSGLMRLAALPLALRSAGLAKTLGPHALSCPDFRRPLRRFPDAGRAAS